MKKISLGKVAMTPAGIWNAATEYFKLDMVETIEGAFVARQDNQGVPVTNAEVWQKLADRGPAGEGNVTVSENGLEVDKLYLFKPSINDKAIGSFTPYTATEQVQSDWNEADSDSKAFIKNKPIPHANVTEATDGLMSRDDKRKLDSVESYANYYIHPNDGDTRHVSDIEKINWESKAAGDHNHDDVYQLQELGKGLSSNDYTTAEKNKLAGVELGAQKNIPAKHKTATLYVSDWTGSEPNFTYVVSDTDIEDGCVINISPTRNSEEIANEAGIYKDATATVGKVILYARNIPGSDITIKYTIEL